jgi:hypothetical protein
MSSVKDVLGLFAKRVQQQSKSNLSKKKKRDTSALYDSIDFKITKSKNSIQLAFLMEKYGKFVDKGVQGAKSSAKAPDSDYSFGKGNGDGDGLSARIFQMVVRKKIQFQIRSKEGFKVKGVGRFMSYKTTAFLISRSIYQKGLETTNFFTTPFENEFKKLPEQVVEAYALEVNGLIKDIFKSND